MVTKIVSWDVGIKNLAYCILLKEGTSYKIQKWDIVDIIDSKDKIKCISCNNKAMLWADKDKDKYRYCGKHKGLHTKVAPAQLSCDNYFEKVFSKQTCDFLPDGKCNKAAYYSCSTDNKFYCATHRKNVVNLINKSYILQKIPKKKCSSYSSSEICQRMYSKLDTIPELLQADDILIENQPSQKNPTMKSVASFLFGYFMMRGIIDKDKSNSTIQNVRYISPSNKLKIDENRTLQVLSKAADESKKYKLTKSLAKKYTTILLKDEPVWLNYLNKYSKKDDLCDAYLQGYHYFYSRIDNRMEKKKKINPPKKDKTKILQDNKKPDDDVKSNKSLKQIKKKKNKTLRDDKKSSDEKKIKVTT